MDINLTKAEIELLDKADNDMGVCGKTDLKCSRCGSDIVVEENGKSYTIKCKKENCISMDYRGI